MQTRRSLSASPTKQSLSGSRDLNLGPGNTGTLHPPTLFQMPEATALLQLFGADDEIRTRDLNLGKVALYQLSYIRLFALLRQS